jgi:hypothetical protein
VGKKLSAGFGEIFSTIFFLFNTVIVRRDCKQRMGFLAKNGGKGARKAAVLKREVKKYAKKIF